MLRQSGVLAVAVLILSACECRSQSTVPEQDTWEQKQRRRIKAAQEGEAVERFASWVRATDQWMRDAERWMSKVDRRLNHLENGRAANDKTQNIQMELQLLSIRLSKLEKAAIESVPGAKNALKPKTMPSERTELPLDRDQIKPVLGSSIPSSQPLTTQAIGYIVAIAAGIIALAIVCTVVRNGFLVSRVSLPETRTPN